MGVSTNVYCVFGISKDWDDDFSDAYDKVYNDTDAPTVILDGMSGEYMIFGVNLYDSGDFRWDEMTNKEVIDPATLPSLEEDFKIRFRAKFPQFADWMDEPFKLHMFVHYS